MFVVPSANGKAQHIPAVPDVRSELGQEGRPVEGPAHEGHRTGDGKDKRWCYTCKELGFVYCGEDVIYEGISPARNLPILGGD